MNAIPILFELAWKSLLVAGATLIVLRFARDRTAGERSWIAHGGLAVLLALPAAALLLPSWAPDHATIDTTGTAAAPLLVATVPAANVTIAPALSAPSEMVPSAALALPSPETVALWLYLVPLALLAMTMLVAVGRLAMLRGRAEIMDDAPWLTALARAQRRMGFKHGTALLVSAELRSPISWGLMRPIILLNPGALTASREAEAIIAHELAHVARLDWAKMLVSRAACAVLWFNPLVWMLAREAHQLREEAADDAVLMSQVDGTDYAALLVNAARHDNQGLLIAAHGVAPGKDSLKRRITRVLDASLPRRPTSVAWSLGGLVIVAGLAAPLAAFDPFTVCTWTQARIDAKAATAPVPAVSARAIELASAVLPAGAASAAPARLTRPLSPSELIQLKAMGVTRRELDTLKAAGISGIDADQAAQAKAIGLTPEYAAAFRRAFPRADFDEMIEARAMGIDPDNAAAMRRAWPGAGLDEIVAARATGVTPDYAAQMRAIFPHADLDDLTEMRAVGVTPDYARRMQGAVGGRLTVDQAVEARALGRTRVRVTPPTPPIPPSAIAAAAHRSAARAVAAARGVVATVDGDDVSVVVDAPDPPDDD